MSDYLGPNQTRVLDSTNRSFESITYQKQKPPLSSEVNLTGKIDAERSQKTVQAMLPSGWANVGLIKSASPSDCFAGDVACGLNPNAFTLVALDHGVETEKSFVWVNGWRILVQGIEGPHYTNFVPLTGSDENNLITLPPPPDTGSAVDFVFLEVWRKLITPNDIVNPYGNVDYYGSPFTNDLIDPARGFETSLRVQLQYRIRVARMDDFSIYPEGFGPSVYIQGPLDEPNTIIGNANFTPVAGDPGLWIAGTGDSLSQELLGTVDGHTYAVPMFAIRRRNTQAYDPRNMSNGCSRSVTDYIAGTSSDRPDDLYNNIIVAEDFLDLRHKVSTSFDFKTVCEDAFKALQANELKTKMFFNSQGGETEGVNLLGVDAVTATPNGWSNFISKPSGYRRWFANAVGSETFFVRKTINQKSSGINGDPWLVNSGSPDAIMVDLDDIAFIGGFPADAVITNIGSEPYALGGYASSCGSVITGRTATLTFTGYAPPPFGMTSLNGVSADILFPVTVEYASGANGLKEVPVNFLESRKIEVIGNTMYPVAMKDQDIRVRTGTLANAVDTTDLGMQYNMLKARGGSTKHTWDFGHEMVYHALGTGTNIVSFDLGTSGYNILGVSSIRVDGVSLISNPSISFSGTAFTIDLNQTIATGKDVEITLYTDNKYFDANKQGRGILDCYQMVDLTPIEAPDNARTTFSLDAGTNVVTAIASYAADNGSCYAFVGDSASDGSRTVLLTNNNGFPAINTSSSIEFSTAPAAGKVIKVPALVRTSIAAGEGYAFFYNYVPYQGLGDSTFRGSIEAVGPAITTSAGSGAITDYTYAVGTMSFVSSNIIDGVGTQWAMLTDASTGELKTRYIIAADFDSTKLYNVSSISGDGRLYLDTTADRVSGAPETYVITALDQPYFSGANIIDRLPTISTLNDASGTSSKIQTSVSEASPVLETRVINRTQDLDRPFVAGLSESILDNRGLMTVYIPEAKIGRSTLGLNFEKITTSGSYKKTYQSYIINKDGAGKLYMMVVGSETDNTSSTCQFNAFSKNDSVDIFELPGRPILANKDN